MFSRMYSDIFYVFRGCGGRQASDHLSLIPNRLLLLPLLKIACEMLRVHSYWSWTQNNSDVACKFHLKNFQFYIRFLSVWTLRITEVLIFFSTIATPPPSPPAPSLPPWWIPVLCNDQAPRVSDGDLHGGDNRALITWPWPRVTWISSADRSMFLARTGATGNPPLVFRATRSHRFSMDPTFCRRLS